MPRMCSAACHVRYTGATPSLKWQECSELQAGLSVCWQHRLPWWARPLRAFAHQTCCREERARRGWLTLLCPQVGALAISGQREDENPHDGELTFLGRVLAQLPVNAQLGKLIVLGHVFGCLDECLVIGE